MDFSGFGNLLKSLIPGLRPNQPVQAKDANTALAQKGGVKGADGVWRFSDSTPQATPALQPIQPQNLGPSNQPDGFVFDYNQLPQDQEYRRSGKRPGFTPQQPPREFGQLLRQFFPNEATSAAAVMATENGQFDPYRPDNINANGSRDRGLWQINEPTFNGLMQRQGNTLKAQGINSFEDAYDPYKSFVMAKMIKEGSKQANPQTNGWGGWFGWQDTGYDLNNDYYSAPDRTDFELRQRGRK